jgi:hypothetical protein
MLLPNHGYLKRVQYLAHNFRLKHKRVLTSSPLCKDEMLRTPLPCRIAWPTTQVPWLPSHLAKRPDKIKIDQNDSSTLKGSILPSF